MRVVSQKRYSTTVRSVQGYLPYVCMLFDFHGVKLSCILDVSDIRVFYVHGWPCFAIVQGPSLSVHGYKLSQMASNPRKL